MWVGVWVGVWVGGWGGGGVNNQNKREFLIKKGEGGNNQDYMKFPIKVCVCVCVGGEEGSCQ